MGGRGRRSRTQRKHFKENRDNVWKRTKQDPSSDPSSAHETNENKSWQPFIIENPLFEEYYKEQGIVSLEEWNVFMESLKKPLPAAFRINSSSQFCDDIRSQLQDDFMQSLQTEAMDDGEAGAIKPLPWYPDNLAWDSNFSRKQIRKNQTLERFHEFLKLENEIGNITRQEAVSMVPPLFLDVRPEHFVLDMCAAPGSKTFQLLEIIYQCTKPGSLPDGMVVANDLDVQRCNLLIHQTKRMCTANLIVTNHEAQLFPGCRSNRNFLNGSEVANNTHPSINQLQFDCVLCDVPCSGDGTLRKAPDLWRKWNFGMGNGLHSLQVLIAMRGLSLLKVGGKMVYSTCSMNPVENEAVVAEILRRSGGSVELVDVMNELPQLIRRPGLRKWKVHDKGVWLASYRDVPKERKSGIHPSMFPTGRKTWDAAENNDKIEDAENIQSAAVNEDTAEPMSFSDSLTEEVSDLPLERCMRIVPHDQNTGAFFIAVLQKLSALPAVQENVRVEETLSPGHDKLDVKVSSQVIEEENGTDPVNDLEEKISEAASDGGIVKDEPDAVDTPNQSGAEPVPAEKKVDSGNGRGKRKLQNQGRWKGVDPVVFLNNDIVINSIKKFYGIDESFPFDGHLVTRNYDTTSVKRIYYISKSVKDVLELNFRVGHPLKITSIGLKMFERQSSREGSSAPCAFRISSEGLPLILPYITKQILYASLVDFKHLLEYKTIKFGDFVDTEFGKEAANLMMGCCVIVLKEADKVSADQLPESMPRIAIGCWRGKASLSVMVTAMDCQELLERLILRQENGEGVHTPENIVDGEETVDVNGTGKDTIIQDIVDN